MTFVIEIATALAGFAMTFVIEIATALTGFAMTFYGFNVLNHAIHI